MIILGVCGSVAAYRACDLARDLMRAGHTVRVCLTDAASQFVSRELFEALTGQPCLESVFEEPIRGEMAHIKWAREADLVLIAPATANTLGKLANGIGDDMLGALVLAYEGPIAIAPAMNPTMASSEQVQSALRTLTERGVTLIEPAEGVVACGEHGQGKLAPNAQIVDTALSLLAMSHQLEGKQVLITSGPTVEDIDSVRYITNRSSGKMGAALARAALARGARVTVVTGPVSIAYPAQATVIPVRSANQMVNAAVPLASQADLIIGVAAVADFRPEEPVVGKIRRGAEPLTLMLIPNPDVIAELAKVKLPHAQVIGFAAEPDENLDLATQKLRHKGLSAIVHNDISRSDIGFEGDQNLLTLLTAEGTVARSEQMSKLRCAHWLLEQIL